MSFVLTLYYRSTVTEVYAFVQYIMTAANFGWLIQFVHRWPASKMILHVFRVYIMHASNVNIFVKKKNKRVILIANLIATKLTHFRNTILKQSLITYMS
jgi:quinol-cytochrome oxidoreductase complex cytochrome b subunit